MANPDRLTGLDASFLHLERDSAHMHVGSVLVFDGSEPSHEELIAQIERRLHLVPRYRQRLAFVPLQQGRPVWVDDPHFNPGYHIRHTALPRPGTEAELKRLAGRLFSQELDRSKPLWEMWLVSGLSGDRFAMIAKTHHALVDGISGVDITTVLFDAAADPAPGPDPEPWIPGPEPSSAQLLADALLERTIVPGEIVRGVRALARGPRQVLARARDGLAAVGAFAFAGGGAPPSPLNVKIGPHRRFTWVEGDLGQFKAIKNELGGTVNDVVLTAVALALGRFLRGRGIDTEGLRLKAMVPVSVRADADRGALGNRVAAMYAPLPTDVEDPVECFEIVHEAMGGLKESGQAVGAQVLTDLADFAPPTIMSQAARLQARQRFFNLVVTNVPGPQFELFMLGRPLSALYPQVPLTVNAGLGIAIMSYHGRLNFGLLGDYDAVPDLELVGEELGAAIDELALAAGVLAHGGTTKARPKTRREGGQRPSGARHRDAAGTPRAVALPRAGAALGRLSGSVRRAAGVLAAVVVAAAGVVALIAFFSGRDSAPVSSHADRPGTGLSRSGRGPAGRRPAPASAVQLESANQRPARARADQPRRDRADRRPAAHRAGRRQRGAVLRDAAPAARVAGPGQRRGRAVRRPARGRRPGGDPGTPAAYTRCRRGRVAPPAANGLPHGPGAQAVRRGMARRRPPGQVAPAAIIPEHDRAAAHRARPVGPCGRRSGRQRGEAA